MRGVMFPVRSCGTDHGITKLNAFRLQNQERLPFCRFRGLSCGQCSQPGILSLHGLASSTREAMFLHYPDLLLYFKSIKECKEEEQSPDQTPRYKYPSKHPFLFHGTLPGALEAAQAIKGNRKQTARTSERPGEFTNGQTSLPLENRAYCY